MIPDITLNPTQLAELRETLAAWPREADKVLRRAINRATAKVRSVMVKRVAKAVGAKQKIVRGRAWQNKARSKLYAKVRAGKIGWPVAEFSPRATRTGVTYKWNRTKTMIDRAFIATMKSGHKGVWVRMPGAKRGQITEQRTPSATDIIEKYGLAPELIQIGQYELMRETKRLTALVLSRKGRMPAPGGTL